MPVVGESLFTGGPLFKSYVHTFVHDVTKRVQFLFSFEGKVGIRNGLSCAVGNDFQLLLYWIEVGKA